MILRRIEARKAYESKNRPFETVPGRQRGPYIGSGQREYSLTNVMRSLAGYRDVDAGFENEILQELAKRSGRNGVKGFLIPSGALATRDLTRGNTGANLIVDNLKGSQFIDVLRSKSTVLGLGPRILDGLIGDISIPRKTAGTTAY